LQRGECLDLEDRQAVAGLGARLLAQPSEALLEIRRKGEAGHVLSPA